MTTLYYCDLHSDASSLSATDVESLLGRLIPKLNYTPSAITSRVKLFTAFSNRCCASNSLQMKTILFRHGLLSSHRENLSFNESRIIAFIYHRPLFSRLSWFSHAFCLSLSFSTRILSISLAFSVLPLSFSFACTNLNLRRLTSRVRPKSLSCRALHREIVS